MEWLAWGLASVVTFGLWGVLVRRVVDALDWRLVALLSFPGYLLPLAGLWAAAPPELQGLSAGEGAGAVLGGVLAQSGVFLLYLSLDWGGKAAVVVPITALYPVVTIAGARLFLGESPSPAQVVGALLAALAVAMVALGEQRPAAAAGLEEEARAAAPDPPDGAQAPPTR
jgi:drug/metabolite transporter (DMT)-like permease